MLVCFSTMQGSKEFDHRAIMQSWVVEQPSSRIHFGKRDGIYSRNRHGRTQFGYRVGFWRGKARIMLM